MAVAAKAQDRVHNKTAGTAEGGVFLARTQVTHDSRRPGSMSMIRTDVVRSCPVVDRARISELMGTCAGPTVSLETPYSMVAPENGASPDGHELVVDSTTTAFSEGVADWSDSSKGNADADGHYLAQPRLQSTGLREAVVGPPNIIAPAVMVPAAVTQGNSNTRNYSPTRRGGRRHAQLWWHVRLGFSFISKFHEALDPLDTSQRPPLGPAFSVAPLK